MVKCEVINENFTLKEYKQLKNVERKSTEEAADNYFRVGDTFECDKEMAAYLEGNNKYNKSFIKVIEVIPNEVSEEVKTTQKKTTKKKK